MDPENSGSEDDILLWASARRVDGAADGGGGNDSELTLWSGEGVGAGKPCEGGVAEAKRVSRKARPAFVIEGGGFTRL